MASVEKLLAHPEALCNMVRRIAVAAGDLTLDYFDGFADPAPVTRKNGTIVTAADRVVEDHIVAALRALTPAIPVVAEEQCAESAPPALDGHEYFWLVDPLDGTAEFLAGSDSYAVNIGLIRNGEPLIGVIYAPARGELYAGWGPDTAVRWMADSDHEKSLRVRSPAAAGLVAIISQRHGDEEQQTAFIENYKIARIQRAGSALKFCQIAAGKADIYPRFGITHEWDTAAGDAILRAAGGAVCTFDGVPLRYGKVAARFINPFFVACRPDLLLPPEN